MSLIGATQRLPLDFEWNGFIKRNSDVLIDPSAPARSVDQIQFANQAHKSAGALVEGTLQRKGRFIRSYSTAYYVVTPSKYLHEFKDNDVSVPKNVFLIHNHQKEITDTRRWLKRSLGENRSLRRVFIFQTAPSELSPKHLVANLSSLGRNQEVL